MTSSQSVKYFFEDRTIIANQKYYYRLKQKDFDGSFEYSKIVVILTKVDRSTFVGEFFPNPTTQDWTRLELMLEKESDVSIRIFNLNGDQLRSIKEYGLKDDIEFSTRDIPNGVYPVEINVNGEIYFRKLVVGF